MIDLSGTTDTAKRGGETDTLIGIEGALGSSGNDTFKGDALNNEFQGKTGKDTMTGGGGRDTWDFNDVADSPAGATRDVVTDFAPGQDVIDLAGIDADSTVPGNQSFRWVGKADAHRCRAARLLRQRRHDHRARQHRRRCGSRARDPAHRREDADRGRLPALTSGGRRPSWIIFLFMLSSGPALHCPGPAAMPDAAVTTPKKRGPKTPEGKARSAMNALKHGLRARDFVLLPEEDPQEWRQHVLDLEQGYGPVDATERKLVDAIAVAMWKEIRADRFEAEVLTDIPPRSTDRCHGSDLQVPDHAAALTTAIRYQGSAGMGARRAVRAFLEHRKAKQTGLLLPRVHARTRDRQKTRTNYPRRSAARCRPARRRPTRRHRPSPTPTRGWPTCRWSRPIRPTNRCAARCWG